MNRTLIIIPAYNAESTVGKLIENIRVSLSQQTFNYDILLVNDGSTDKTGALASDCKVTAVSHALNLGKGEALKTGFKFASDHAYEAIVLMDADLQHDPAVLPAMLKFYLTNSYDIVIGTRTFDTKKMSLPRIVSNRITSVLMSLRTGYVIPDSQSGYRIIRTEMIKGMTLDSSRYEFESELLIRLAQKKAKMGFFPIETIYGNEKSHIRHLRDTVLFIKMFIHSFFY